jgi:hypothetical protein
VRVRQRVRAKLMVELYHTADSLATSLSTLEHPNATQPAAAPTTPSQPNTLADVCAHRPMRRFDRQRCSAVLTHAWRCRATVVTLMSSIRNWKLCGESFSPSSSTHTAVSNAVLRAKLHAASAPTAPRLLCAAAVPACACECAIASSCSSWSAGPSSVGSRARPSSCACNEGRLERTATQRSAAQRSGAVRYSRRDCGPRPCGTCGRDR